MDTEASIPHGLATVTYPGSSGAAVAHVIDEGEVASFGASADCVVRFGHAPVRDPAVPGIAGRLLAIASRLIVECAETPGYRALEVRVPGEPTRLVSLGEAFSPRARCFTVVVAGSTGNGWPFGVAVRRQSVPRGRSPVRTAVKTVDLTKREREVLRCYAAPLRRGMVEPATHQDVASALGIKYNRARNYLYSINSKFFAAELPMPEVSDTRIAVVECARLHGLLDDADQ